MRNGFQILIVLGLGYHPMKKSAWDLYKVFNGGFALEKFFRDPMLIFSWDGSLGLVLSISENHSSNKPISWEKIDF